MDDLKDVAGAHRDDSGTAALDDALEEAYREWMAQREDRRQALRKIRAMWSENIRGLL